MQAILYLPYYDYNDEAFDVGDNYYKNNSDYVNAMQQNFQATNNAVANKMANYINGQSVSDYQSIDGQTYRFAKTSQDSEEKASYSECECIVYGEDGKDKTIDDFVSECVSNDVQLYVLKLNFDTIGDEFEEELILWTNEHNGLKRFSNDEDWIFENEPKRNLKLKFINKANEEKFAELVNCKIMERQGLNIYVVLAEDVKLINKIK